MVDQTLGQSQAVEKEVVNSITFNNYKNCFAVATNRGFWIYSINPTMQQIRRDIKGGLKLAQMIGITNILLLLPTGDDPAYRNFNVIIWDDKHLTSKLIDVTQDGSEVISVSYANDTYFIGKRDRLYCLKFQLDRHEILKEIGPCENPKGIHAVSLLNEQRQFCVATPNKEAGHVQLDWFSREVNGDGNLEIVPTGKVNKFKAHDGRVTYITFDAEGKQVATASEKGTLIRVFNTETQECLRTLRRGNQSAEITYLSFEKTGQYLVSCSTHPTIHIFRLDQSGTTSFGYAVSYLKKDADAEWSFAQFDLTIDKKDDVQRETKAFVHENQLFVFTQNCKFYQVPIPKQGGNLGAAKHTDTFLGN